MNLVLANFIIKHAEFFVGLLFSLLLSFGFTQLKEKILDSDKNKNIEKALTLTHSLLDKIKDKTDTKLDNYLDSVVLLVLKLMKEKEDLVEVNDDEKEAFLSDVKNFIREKLKNDKEA